VGHLDFANLGRHPGLTTGLVACYTESARICLSRRHRPPSTWTVEVWQDREVLYGVDWQPPSRREMKGYANADDATRDGAYAMALLAADVELGLVTHSRAETRTGCDWYLQPVAIEDQAAVDFDTVPLTRLEVSGISDDDRHQLIARVSRKLRQLMSVASQFPSAAAVVGFQSRTVLFRNLPI
jgi:hypothetical protein